MIVHHKQLNTHICNLYNHTFGNIHTFLYIHTLLTWCPQGIIAHCFPWSATVSFKQMGHFSVSFACVQVNTDKNLQMRGWQVAGGCQGSVSLRNHTWLLPTPTLLMRRVT